MNHISTLPTSLHVVRPTCYAPHYGRLVLIHLLLVGLFYLFSLFLKNYQSDPGNILATTAINILFQSLGLGILLCVFLYSASHFRRINSFDSPRLTTILFLLVSSILCFPLIMKHFGILADDLFLITFLFSPIGGYLIYQACYFLTRKIIPDENTPVSYIQLPMTGEVVKGMHNPYLLVGSYYIALPKSYHDHCGRQMTFQVLAFCQKAYIQLEEGIYEEFVHTVHPDTYSVPTEEGYDIGQILG
jgi:multisubunit Na+/H+ antiporter MnhG subunit